MRRAWTLYALHVAALAFGLGGILIALPNPHLWSGSKFGTDVFEFGMSYGGASHIVLGALTMLALGFSTIGWKKTLVFFLAAYPISLSAELIGTTTGWPFGEYAYTTGLGLKVLGRVPFTIPLSWFYVGFASYLLGITLARRYVPRHQSIGGVLAGVYLLVVWDLVLDPAMAHEELPVKFWQWFDSGSYFGMPMINFAGWAGTGLIFVGAARLAWRRGPDAETTPIALPFMLYLANMIFAMVLSLSVGLWQPVVIAAVFGVIPAAFTLRNRIPSGSRPGTGSPIGQAVVSTGASLLARRRGVAIEQGVPPPSGPAILVSRHFHHLWDGCAILASAGRPAHIVVGLDWIERKPVRTVMEMVCRSAGWPVVLRQERFRLDGNASAYRVEESSTYLLRAMKQSIEILRAGELLVMFPEGFPNIDPGYTPKTSDHDSLPFREGFATIARLAEARLGTRIPIIPVGLGYESPESGVISVRYGNPLYRSQFGSDKALIQQVEQTVMGLSGVSRASTDIETSKVTAS